MAAPVKVAVTLATVRSPTVAVVSDGRSAFSGGGYDGSKETGVPSGTLRAPPPGTPSSARTDCRERVVRELRPTKQDNGRSFYDEQSTPVEHLFARGR